MPQLDFYFSPRYAPPEKSFTIVSLVVNVPLLRMEQRFSTGLTHDSPENEREKIQLLNFPSVKTPLLFSNIYPRFSKCGIVKRSSKLFEKRIWSEEERPEWIEMFSLSLRNELCDIAKESRTGHWRRLEGRSMKLSLSADRASRDTIWAKKEKRNESFYSKQFEFLQISWKDWGEAVCETNWNRHNLRMLRTMRRLVRLLAHGRHVSFIKFCPHVARVSSSPRSSSSLRA